MRSAGLGPMLQSAAAAARLRAAAAVECGGGGKAGRECDVKKEVIAIKRNNKNGNDEVCTIIKQRVINLSHALEL